MHAEFVDSMHGMPTLVAFGQVKRRERELTSASQRLLTRTLRQLRLFLLESGLSQFALAAVPALVLIVIAARSTELNAFAVFALVLLSIELVRPLRDLAAQWHAGYMGTYSGPLVMDLLATDQAHQVHNDAGPTAKLKAPLPVQVEAISARYPGADEPTLHDVTARIDAGLTVVVGETGSGKSTLAAVLVGLLPAESGRILLAGRPVAAGTLSRNVTLVAQDPILFSPTIGEELLLAMPEPHERSLVEAVAARAGIGRDGDPLTLQTPLGDDGAVLSGGQRQRVAIARGDLQQGRILVLDEATSALDPHSEAEIISAICEARPDDAVVAVTHRISIARRADHVIVVDDGRIIEDGSPAELLHHDGAFAALVQAERTVVR
jgi:ABC-type transport system involved in cytochrome bd biosynthesis fused ATPase/permease subunit